MKREWGRYYVPDRRDRGFLMAPPRSQRKSRYWRSTWIGDQGTTPHCVGYAWAGWLIAPPIRQFLNPSGVYEMAQYCDEWQGQEYDGTSVRGAAKVLHSLGMIQSYRWSFDAATIVDTILEKGPVVIGVSWHQGMLNTDHSGYIAPTGNVLGGHAVLLDGANRVENFVRVKNSWGSHWGRNGRAQLRIDDLDALIRDNGEACIGVEALPRAV